MSSACSAAFLVAVRTWSRPLSRFPDPTRARLCPVPPFTEGDSSCLGLCGPGSPCACVVAPQAGLRGLLRTCLSGSAPSIGPASPTSAAGAGAGAASAASAASAPSGVSVGGLDVAPVSGQGVFTALFTTWSHSPMATLSLCLLAQAYELACFLVLKLYVPVESAGESGCVGHAACVPPPHVCSAAVPWLLHVLTSHALRPACAVVHGCCEMRRLQRGEPHHGGYAYAGGQAGSAHRVARVHPYVLPAWVPAAELFPARVSPAHSCVYSIPAVRPSASVRT
jgi:hypothetical protein